jgi:hypothetical protein
MQEHIIGIGFQRHLCVRRDTKRLAESLNDFDQRGCWKLCGRATAKKDGGQWCSACAAGDDFVANGIDVTRLRAIFVARIGIEVTVATLLGTKRDVHICRRGDGALRLPVPRQEVRFHPKCVRGARLF